jgi:N-acetylglutamate synthase-like GNAT family acetyltransferase
MEVREATVSELESVKALIDAFEELDTDESTYTLEYYERLLDEGLVLVAIGDGEFEIASESEPDDIQKTKVPPTILGACFGKYDEDEDWADMLGLAVREPVQGQGIGTALVGAFETAVADRDISTIDLFAHESRRGFFDELGYDAGNTYVAFRKRLD